MEPYDGHASVRVFCPCSEPLTQSHQSGEEVTDDLDLPSTIFNKETRHLLPYVNFCEQCQAVKCRRCIELEIVAKFCPSCMNTMKPDHNYCSRNCFDCPLCDSHLNIHQKANSIKNFKFRCPSCDFSYETGELENHKNLSRFINHKANQSNESEQFRNLQNFYIQSKNINSDLSKEMVLKFEKLKLKNNRDIQEFLRSATINKFNPTTDIQLSKFKESLRSNDQILSSKQSIDTLILSPSLTKLTPPLPKSTRLRAKHSKRCKACRTSLMKPDTDPYSSKFYNLSNAIDYLPTMNIYTYKDVTPHPNQPGLGLLLSMKNPLDQEINVNISTFATVPGAYTHKVNIPISEFKIGKKPENASKLDGFVKTLTSLELSKDNKMSRIELMNRKIQSLESFQFDSLYETGANFIVIPIKLSLIDTSCPPQVLEVPILVSIKSEALSFAYWCVLKLDGVPQEIGSPSN